MRTCRYFKYFILKSTPLIDYIYFLTIFYAKYNKMIFINFLQYMQLLSEFDISIIENLISLNMINKN